MQKQPIHPGARRTETYRADVFLYLSATVVPKTVFWLTLELIEKFFVSFSVYLCTIPCMPASAKQPLSPTFHQSNNSFFFSSFLM